MDTQSIKTSELTGPALWYAVATAAGYELTRNNPKDHGQRYRVRALQHRWPFKKPKMFCIGEIPVGNYCPSSYFWPDRDWSQLGPLIEAHGVNLCRGDENCEWLAYLTAGADIKWGDTPLIAACRAIAASHWGEYADIPSELVQEQSDE